MNGIILKLYFDEFKKEGNTPLYEHLLKLAHSLNIEGVTICKGIAGYGRLGKIHEEHFWELGSNVPVEMTMLTSRDQGKSFLDKITEGKINLTYSMTECAWGRI